jgi:3-deoxy-D-manno-octulosonic-acid transferase
MALGPPGSAVAPGRGALALYRLAWILATPLAVAYLLWRARRQPEYRQHWRERWALAPGRDDATRPVWIHAVSVGETRAAQPLIEAMLARDPDLRLLLTHMTPTGRSVGEELFVRRWPERVRQAYLPYDYPGAMRRFLARWQPRVGIIMETELWPNLCAAAARRPVPLVLVNARLSPRSLRKGLRWRALIEPALGSLAAVLAQTEADAARLRQLGRGSVTVLGNLKFDITPAPAPVALGRQWRAAPGARPLVLAASTRDGEEALLLQAWRALCPPGPQAPQLLIVPRHPQRFDAVAAEIVSAGFPLARRSGAWPSVESAVLLGDSMGEMPAYYAMAEVAIIGGSLLPFGAQNLIEACALGVPVIVGPHTYNFEQAAIEAIDAGAARRVDDAHAALVQALALLADDPTRSAMARAGLAFTESHRGATARTMAALQPWLGAGASRPPGPSGRGAPPA